MGHLSRPAATSSEEEREREREGEVAGPVTGADAMATPEGEEHEQEKRQRRRRRRNKRRRVPSEEEVAALRSVLRWARSGEAGHEEADALALQTVGKGRRRPRVAVELHAHSARSDGSLSPSALVQRAQRNGVKVLALTDHDTMAGVPEAIESAKEYSLRIIPGVEISAVYSPSDGTGADEPVHILAYYGSLGPAKSQELEDFLASIRDGRYTRAKKMLLKLRNLNMPMELEDVCAIAGDGVAPGRLHVARAMVEAGYVDNLRQAFSRYLYDGGPAYATGSEPTGESVVELVCRTGGVAVLAHPWALKNHVAVTKDLKAAGLHGIEVYRSNGKLSGLSDLADTYGLLKLGGSDYHGRDDKEEPDVGSVDLPVLAVSGFLDVARPIWQDATNDILANTTPHKTLVLNGSNGFQRVSSGNGFCDSRFFPPDQEVTDASEVEALQTQLADVVLHNNGP
ncbi:hypothetical protein GUJ93_ZPchr0006g43199 [Zizania palustris]|uniref:Polymerase/histidinol phosphatase N-terminal domain-containing protein n=1 Tax=Zizania palustris TaxID=103762 RepID=A0A8J5TD27_ZIZPA|nr:hypothetical protein GUJ93_ZPchr0006g43199 [Zizania palustris]